MDRNKRYLLLVPAHKGRVGTGAGGIDSLTLYAYSIPAVLLFMPDAAMGFAVSHVRAFTDGSAPHSVMVDFLVLSGVAAALLALVLPHVVKLKGRRQPTP